MHQQFEEPPMDGEQDLELETGSGAALSPLKERLEQFRTSDDDGRPAPAGKQPTGTGGGAGEEEEDDVVEQTPVPRRGEGDEAIEEVEETDQERQAREAREAAETDEGKAAREAREAEGEAERGKGAQGRPLRSIEIRTFDGEKTSTLIIDGLPQEYHDSIQNHVRRSLRLEHVERRLGESKKQEAVAQFYTTDPLNAMRLVDRDMPEMSAAFVENWIQQHPKEAAEYIGKHFPADRNKETLSLQAKLAAREAKDELDQSWNRVQSRTKHQDFADNASRLVQDLAGPLQLGGEDRDVFE